MTAKKKPAAAPSQPQALTPEQQGDYNTLVSAVQLVSVDLERTSAQIHHERLIGNDDGEWPLKVSEPLYRSTILPEQKMLYCGVRFRLVIGPNEAKPLIEVEAEYCLLYKMPEGTPCSEEIARHFAGRNAVFNAWPFFREHAHSMVAKMGVPPVVLPLFRLPHCL